MIKNKERLVILNNKIVIETEGLFDLLKMDLYGRVKSIREVSHELNVNDGKTLELGDTYFKFNQHGLLVKKIYYSNRDSIIGTLRKAVHTLKYDYGINGKEVVIKHYVNNIRNDKYIYTFNYKDELMEIKLDPKWARELPISIEQFFRDGNISEESRYTSDIPDSIITTHFHKNGGKAVIEKKYFDDLGRCEGISIIKYDDKGDITESVYEDYQKGYFLREMKSIKTTFSNLYDSYGKLVESISRKNGKFFEKHIFSYDKCGRMIDRKILKRNGDMVERWTYSYDVYGKILQEYHYNYELNTTNTQKNHYVYDEKKNWITKTEIHNNERTYITWRKIRYYK